MRTNEHDAPIAAAPATATHARPAPQASPSASLLPAPATTGASVRCVRLDGLGRPVETFAGRCSVLDDGCVVVLADRSVRVGEQVHLTFPVAGGELTDTFKTIRSIAIFRPGREPEYRLSFELDDDAGVDLGGLLGSRQPDLF